MLEYDAKAPVDVPNSLFVKIRETKDPFADIMPGEFAFYSEQMPSGLPLPIIYDTSSEIDGALTCIVMQDLSETHSQTRWPMPPTISQCEDAVCALAHLHGHWWTHDLTVPQLVGIDLQSRTETISDYIKAFIPEFIKQLGDRLSPPRQEIIRTVCAKLPDLLCNRLSGGLPITRVHGDPHYWNIMFHNDPARRECIFFDWEDWHYDPGAYDLAYMIALHWFPERRARHEEHLLRLYHETLSGQISTPYSWEQLWADYRLGHLHNFIVPLFQVQMGIGPAAWWEHVERLFLAYEDLGCADLL
ncbi:MAG: aminoglycoside phosphotransferase family protein [Rhodospirillales bacterium]|nr:aminoglycoside phosphotransferase family protein [Rhodospirillales bacterium]